MKKERAKRALSYIYKVTYMLYVNAGRICANLMLNAVRNCYWPKMLL
jgi:hypothetical protein